MFGKQAFLQEMRLIRNIVPSFQTYPFRLSAIKNLHTRSFHPKVLVLLEKMVWVNLHY